MASDKSTVKLEICENSSDAVKIAAAARYLPMTMSKSAAGSVSNNSSVPWRRSSDQMLIVIAGMKTSMIPGRYRFSCPRLARFAVKNSCGQNAANDDRRTNKQRNTYPVGLLKYPTKFRFSTA